MIEFISGKIHLKLPHRVVVNHGGMGYDILVPFSTSRELKGAGSEVFLLCHLHWREEGPQLFGFLTEQERQLFRVLTHVNKVGPKLALNIMSATSPEALATMILSEDIVRLTSLKGVGPKLASRLVVELKDAIAKLGIGAVGEAAAAEASTIIVHEPEVRAALENLGYTNKEITQALKSVKSQLNADSTIEEIIEAVLRSFSA